MQNRRSALFAGLMVVIALVVTFAGCEALVRLSGKRPAQVIAAVEEAGVFSPDAQLGWKNKPGHYRLRSPAAKTDSIDITFLPDGTRWTGGSGTTEKRLALLGCSFTVGFGLTDTATYAWKLQTMFPKLSVRNYGTSGYSTYQSLLLMDRVLGQGQAPQVVLYGLLDDHENRNVASTAWLSALLRRDDRFGEEHRAVPYVSIDGGGHLREHRPTRYPDWPGRHHLASVAFLADAYSRLLAHTRTVRRTQATDSLLIGMRSRTERSGAAFGVVLLRFEDPALKKHYIDFLAREAIPTFDCAFPLVPAMLIQDNFHPNGIMNSRYAECVADGLRKNFGVE
jgi:hypothetical protein